MGGEGGRVRVRVGEGLRTAGGNTVASQVKILTLS